MKALLLAFQEWTNQPITFESFDFNFYEEFVSFLTFDYVQRRRKDRIVGLKVNSIGKTIKQLRIFLRNRARRKIITPIDLEDFTIMSEDSDAIYLTRQEITRIYHTDLSQHSHLIPYRDLFVLACLTGLRFSDFRSIRPEDIRKGMLHKKQDKSDHWVVIPLRTEAKEVLMRYFNSKPLYLTNAEFNRHIKTVGYLAGITETIRFSYKKGNKDIVTVKPKCDWITTHTARRSFCTNEFLAGTPVELIMKISGHKSVKDFYRYIRITPEEAGHKISRIWQQRGEILTSL